MSNFKRRYINPIYDILRNFPKSGIYSFALVLFTIFSLGWIFSDQPNKKTADKKKVKIGAYFYDGWSSKNRFADDPNEPWAKDAPRMLTRRMVEEFPEREPIWGWRGDSQGIVEKQIDLASEHGIDFFLFCWYWRDTNSSINLLAIENAPHHVSMNLYMKARNKNKLKFGLLVANHQGAEIKGADNWEAAARYWMPYFKDSQYVTVDNKPFVVIFNPVGLDEEGIARMQKVAKEHGFKGLSIAGCGNPERLNEGFTHRTHYNIVPGYRGGSEEHQYSELVESHKKQWFGSTERPYIPEVTVGWDKRPWEGPKGINAPEGYYFPDGTPEQFEEFLKDAITWMDNHPEQTTKERMILLYAWNEMGEGGYLVPTKEDPEGKYLQVIKKVVYKE